MNVSTSGGKGAPTFKKTAPIATPPVVPIPSGVKDKPVLSLPVSHSMPVQELGECSILLYGEKKIGKTSLASCFPSALFMLFEPGGKGLEIYSRDVRTWDEFKTYVSLIVKDNNFKTIVIDTVDIAYDRCQAYVCKKEGVDHPSEGSYGSVWTSIKTEFVDTMNKLLMSNKGVIFISHAEVGEFHTYTGPKNKIIPSMSKQARSAMAAVADIIMYYGYRGQDRYVTIAGDESLDAGHRLKFKFWVQGKEKEQRVHSIPMGNSEDEGYKNICDAFDNHQEDDGKPEIEATLSDTKVGFKGKKK